MKKIIILGINGMLGHQLFRTLSEYGYEVVGTKRTPSVDQAGAAVIPFSVGPDAEVNLRTLLADAKPDIVINCIGHIKQKTAASLPLEVIPVNALFPHQAAAASRAVGARFIHFSTDCVFSGRDGSYLDDAPTDVSDFYGLTKYLGEVRDLPGALTLRTSIIGHELTSALSLIDWFLAQEGTISGFTKAIFSGLPTNEVARVLHEYVLSDDSLDGLYNLSVDPISKFDLLMLVAKIYGKDIDILPDSSVAVDRSLNSDAFQARTGYVPPTWEELLNVMHQSRSET